jgi:SAM-dependent methyltransferase
MNSIPTSHDIRNSETAKHYDTAGGMFAPEVLGPTVERLAQLVGNGSALEFAIGTGRVAIPLARRGVRVTGIELSPAMVAQLRTKADEATIPVVLGDMTTATAPGKYALVYLVYNTISNLLTQAEQVACFRNAARHLTAGGQFVIELWVPELRKLPPGQRAVVWRSEPGYVGLDTYDVLRQQIVSHHFTFDESGQPRLFRSPHRYIWPDELDLMAQLAGFDLETRLRTGPEPNSPRSHGRMCPSTASRTAIRNREFFTENTEFWNLDTERPAPQANPTKCQGFPSLESIRVLPQPAGPKPRAKAGDPRANPGVSLFCASLPASP